MCKTFAHIHHVLKIENRPIHNQQTIYFKMNV
jgi:hypothetical protein